MSDLKARFEQAAEDVKSLTSKPSSEDLLKLYAYFKQANNGDVAGKRPGFTNPVARAKFDAWADLKGTSADDAMTKYIGVVERLLG